MTMNTSFQKALFFLWGARIAHLWERFPSTESRALCYTWVEFVAVSCPCSPGFPVFFSQENQHFYTVNCNSIWRQWINSHSVDVPLLVPIHFFYSFIVLFKWSRLARARTQHKLAAHLSWCSKELTMSWNVPGSVGEKWLSLIWLMAFLSSVSLS